MRLPSFPFGVFAMAFAMQALSAQSLQIPAPFQGVWTGMVSQIPDIGAYRTKITLPAGAVGSIDYTDLACGGTWTLTEVRPDRLIFRETITYGGCLDGNTTFRRDGDFMSYSWENAQQYPNYSGWGTFEREGSHPLPPTISPGAVLNGASFAAPGEASSAPAPGSLISIFGEGFSSGLVVAGAGPLPNTLGGVRLTIDGNPAPLYFVSPNQINAFVPASAGVRSVRVRVVTPAGLSPIVNVTLAAVSPAVFTLDQSGIGQGIVVFAGSATLTAPVGTTVDSRPATAGDTITIYAGGLGAVTPTVPDGFNSCTDGICSPDFSNLTLRHVVTPVRVEIGGVAIPAANVLFAGLTPQFAGLYQINVTLPEGLPPGNAQPILLRQGNFVSRPGVTIAVR